MFEENEGEGDMYLRRMRGEDLCENERGGEMYLRRVREEGRRSSRIIKNK
jgi:hypothetical protein